MKNPDLIAALGCLVALLVVGGIYAFSGKQVLPMELQAAMGAFILAALARWRLGARTKAKAVSLSLAPERVVDEPTSLLGAPVGDDKVGDSGEATEIVDTPTGGH